jgi:hypothetical protein
MNLIKVMYLHTLMESFLGGVHATFGWYMGSVL